jgi:hypothetical protein
LDCGLSWRDWATAWAAGRTREVSLVLASCVVADFALLALVCLQYFVSTRRPVRISLPARDVSAPAIRKPKTNEVMLHKCSAIVHQRSLDHVSSFEFSHHTGNSAGATSVGKRRRIDQDPLRSARDATSLRIVYKIATNLDQYGYSADRGGLPVPACKRRFHARPPSWHSDAAERQ